MKFTVQYLDAPGATVRHSSELDAESAFAAETSAQIGFRWARETYDACFYRVLNDVGVVIATGPRADSDARWT